MLKHISWCSASVRHCCLVIHVSPTRKRRPRPVASFLQSPNERRECIWTSQPSSGFHALDLYGQKLLPTLPASQPWRSKCCCCFEVSRCLGRRHYVYVGQALPSWLYYKPPHTITAHKRKFILMQLKGPKHLMWMRYTRWSFNASVGMAPCLSLQPAHLGAWWWRCCCHRHSRCQNKCIQTALHPEPVFPHSSASPTVTAGRKNPQGESRAFLGCAGNSVQARPSSSLPLPLGGCHRENWGFSTKAGFLLWTK